MNGSSRIYSAQNGRRIFYFIVSRVALVDYDLLAFHVFQVKCSEYDDHLVLIRFLSRQILDGITDHFDFVVDLTDFSPSTELPINWMRRSIQMCPPAILPFVNVSISDCGAHDADTGHRRLHCIIPTHTLGKD